MTENSKKIWREIKRSETYTYMRSCIILNVEGLGWKSILYSFTIFFYPDLGVEKLFEKYRATE